MNSLFICTACRRAAGRIRAAQITQWQSRASFISLNDKPPTTRDDRFPEDLPKLDSTEDEKSGRSMDSAAIPARKKRAPRQSYDNGDELEALFEQSARQLPPEAEQTPVLRSVDLYIQADSLRKMLADDRCALGDTWDFFVQHFGPAVWEKDRVRQKTQQMHHAKQLLARKLLRAKQRDAVSSEVPTVTEFSKVFSQLGMLQCQEWVELMVVLLDKVIKLEKGSESSLETERLISDILGSWNVVYRSARSRDAYPKESFPLDWSHIPTLDLNAAASLYRSRGTQGLFRIFAPGFELKQQRNLALVAVATFALFTKSSFKYNTEVQHSVPLISSLGAAISTHEFDVGSIKVSGSEAVPTSIMSFIRASASGIKETALAMRSNFVTDEPVPKYTESRPPSIQFASPSSNPDRDYKIRGDITSMGKRLFDALHRRDLPQVKKLWSDARNFPVVTDLPETIQEEESNWPTTSKRGILTLELCNYFIMIFMSLHQPGEAIKVWNHMVQNGLTPNLKTWSAMLTGCKTSRNAKALEDVWMRMLRLGVQPDVVLWTIRITGLVHCNKAQEAMLALDHMGRLWLNANEPQTAKKNKKGKSIISPEPPSSIDPVQPTIETVNAVVSALLRKRLAEQAHRVLSWSAKFNIVPNVITYNTLLMPLIRDGKRQDAMALLKQMASEGIAADVGTFTTILEEILGSEDTTPEEQQTITSGILSEMDSAGLQANLFTYGRMIYQLLKNPNVDMNVVNVVMEHMAQQGLQPTAHIYTIIVSHYFDLDPPDLEAVRNLTERLKDEIGSTDHKFWDRVIEGYARAGDTTTAMRVLGKHEGNGNRAAWVTKHVLLTSLVQNDEWPVARSFVANVKADTGAPSPKMRNQTGQQNFWRLAAELELL